MREDYEFINCEDWQEKVDYAHDNLYNMEQQITILFCNNKL